MKAMPSITSVVPQPAYCLLLNFENGETRLFDAKPYLKQGAFQQLQKAELFNAVVPQTYFVQWPGDIDLGTDTLYLNSVPIQSHTP